MVLISCCAQACSSQRPLETLPPSSRTPAAPSGLTLEPPCPGVAEALETVIGLDTDGLFLGFLRSTPPSCIILLSSGVWLC